MKYKTLLITTCAIVVVIGILMVYSSSFWISKSLYSDGLVMLRNHLIYLCISIAMAYFISKIPIHWLRNPTLLITILVVSIILLGALIFTPTHFGARRWFKFLCFSIQPTELIKIGVILYLSAVLSNYCTVNNPILLLKSIIIVGVICGLILLQPHFGMFAIIITVSSVLFFVSGVKLKYLMLTGALLAGVTFCVIMDNSYMYNRIKNYITKEKSYHTQESLKSIGSGGFFGKGLGLGQAKVYHLPIPHSDSVYAVLAEEGGFLLAASVLILFFLIFYSGMKISISAVSSFESLLGIGLTLLIIVPFLINIGVVTSILPVTGLALPFISYGGSALLSNMLCIGLLINIARTTWRTKKLRDYVF